VSKETVVEVKRSIPSQIAEALDAQAAAINALSSKMDAQIRAVEKLVRRVGKAVEGLEAVAPADGDDALWQAIDRIDRGVRDLEMASRT
jgi:hypothetical protein